MAVRELGQPVALSHTAGHHGDMAEATLLIASLLARMVLADGAHDAAHFRQAIADEGATVIILNTPQRASPYAFGQHLYREQHLIECCFSRLKQFCRVVARFGNTPATTSPS